jgi:MFS family permease
MIAPEEQAPQALSTDSLTTLRGAGVDVDVRRLGRVVGGMCLAGLAAVAIVLFAAGVDKNAQITDLHQRGVAVQITVTGCMGLLGGSGSNPVGYACTGTVMLDGHRYRESIPGDTLYPPGAKIRGVAVPGDPPLLSTPHAVATERASWNVFVVPTILLAAFLFLVGAVGFRRRKARRPDPASLPAEGPR